MMLKNGRLLLPIALICLCLLLLLTRIDFGETRAVVFLEGIFPGLVFSLSVFRLVTILLSESHE